MDKWIITATSQIGTSHVESKIPCQDSFVVEQNEKWLSVVVSDGAGTAKFAQQGSQFVSKFFSKTLIDLSREIDKKQPGPWVNDYLIQKITEIRAKFRDMAASEQLDDYHCTLVACLIGEQGGFLIQIGDGAIFGGVARAENNQTVLSDGKFISLPENGEYANETYFITENSWIKHLRIKPISKVDWICLGTDGGMTLAMHGEKKIKVGFILPLIQQLVSIDDSSKREKKLIEILSAEEVNKLTSDDKTLCIAYKESILKLPQDYLYEEQGTLRSNEVKNDTKNKINKIPLKNNHDRKNRIDDITADKKKNYLTCMVILVLVIISIGLGYFKFKPSEIKVTSENKNSEIPEANNPSNSCFFEYFCDKENNENKNKVDENKNKIISEIPEANNPSENKTNEVENMLRSETKEVDIKQPPNDLEKKINLLIKEEPPKTEEKNNTHIDD